MKKKINQLFNLFKKKKKGKILGQVEYSLNSFLQSTGADKTASLTNNLSRERLISESLYQLSTNFANIQRKAQYAFILFCQCMTTWGIGRLKMKKAAHCTNGFLVKGDSQAKVEEMKNRFVPDVSQKVNVPCSLKFYNEFRITFCESYYSQMLKILGFCIAGSNNNLSGDAIDTLRLIQNRAQTELQAKTLMNTNALLHKFDSRYSPL